MKPSSDKEPKCRPETESGLAISVVVPVYNEEECLPDLHRKLMEVLNGMTPQWELIYVDDGSRDDSHSILAGLAKEEARVKVVKFSRNFGQTAALAAGIDLARGEFIVTIDADLQNDPEDIPNLYKEAKPGVAVVSGWRKDRKDNLIKRKIPSWMANRMISWFSGLRLHDYGCTLKVYRARNVKRIQLYGEMHRFIPALVYREGGKVVELPVGHYHRTRGKSKYGLERVMKVALDLLLLKFMSGYATRPIHFFGLFATFCMVGGGLVGVWALYERFINGLLGINLLPLVLLTMLLLLVGVQTLLMGLLGEIGIRTYHESQQKPTYVVDHIINCGSDRSD